MTARARPRVGRRVRFLVWVTGAGVLACLAFTMLMFDAALAKVSGLGVAALGTYAVGFLAVAFVAQMPAVRQRAMGLDEKGAAE